MANETTAAPIVGTTDDDFDRITGDANLPSKPVPLCLHGNLRREYEEIKGRIADRAAERDAARTAAAAADNADTRLASRGPAAPVDERDPEQDRLDELRDQMRARMVTFIVTAVRSTEYNRILQAHPPRRDPATGRIDQRDYNGYNSATFPPDLVRKSITTPTMTDARWAKLDALLTDAQFDKLFNAAVDVNRRDEDLPF